MSNNVLPGFKAGIWAGGGDSVCNNGTVRVQG